MCAYQHIKAHFCMFSPVSRFSRFLEIFWDSWASWIAQIRDSLELPFAASRFFEIFRNILRFSEIFWDILRFSGTLVLFFACIKHFFQIQHVESQNFFSLPTKAYRSKIPPIHGAPCFWWLNIRLPLALNMARARENHLKEACKHEVATMAGLGFRGWKTPIFWSGVFFCGFTFHLSLKNGQAMATPCSDRHCYKW